MAARRNSAEEPVADRQLLIERIIQAPPEVVWQAWTDPKQIVQWWGPNGFTTTIETMDVRPKGIWKYVIHGPDGTNYPNLSTFIEVVPPERIVFSHDGGAADRPQAQFESTWTFEALGKDQTRVTIDMRFPTAALRDSIVQHYGAVEGGHQTLHRLATLIDRA